MKRLSFRRTPQAGAGITCNGAWRDWRRFGATFLLLFWLLGPGGIAAAASPDGAEKTEVGKSTTVTAQELAGHMLDLIRDIRSVNDVSADLIVRHFGQLDQKKPEQADAYGITVKLTANWFYELTRWSPSEKMPDLRTVRLQLVRVGGDAAADMRAVCVSVRDYREGLIAAGFRKEEQTADFRTISDWRAWRYVTDDVLVSLDSWTGAGDDRDCVVGVLVMVTRRDSDVAAYVRRSSRVIFSLS